MATQREVQVVILNHLLDAVEEFQGESGQFSASKLATAKSNVTKFLDKRAALLAKQHDAYVKRQQAA